MLSALRRLRGKNDASPPGPGQTSHVQAMSSQLQRRFARGVQYNMKVLIRGDTNVGKTSLFERLQGRPFSELYSPTPEIQVASIQWSYKVTDDVVKVEIWDVVDKAKKKRMEGLKLENEADTLPEDAALDAEFLDVYKGAHCVIMVLDITKAWTFDYVQREVPLVPAHIPVLILGNQRDLADRRQVRDGDVRWFAETVRGSSATAPVRYAESCMRNGFGLRLLHRFLNLPFLSMQRDCLQRQLAANSCGLQATMQELELHDETDEADYQLFASGAGERRRLTAPTADGRSLAHSQTTQALSTLSESSEVAAAALPSRLTHSHSTQVLTGSVSASPSPTGAAYGGGAAIQVTGNCVVDGSSVDVDTFSPDATLDAGFLQDSPAHVAVAHQQQRPADSDSDDPVGNPMVAAIEDDVDTAALTQLAPVSATASVTVRRPSTGSSSDEEQCRRPVATNGDGRTGLRRDARLVLSSEAEEAPPPVDAPEPQMRHMDSYVVLGEPSEEEVNGAAVSVSSAAGDSRPKHSKKKDKKDSDKKKKKRKHAKDSEPSNGGGESNDPLEDFLNES